MKKQRKEWKKRVLSVVMAFAIVLTGITWPEIFQEIAPGLEIPGTTVEAAPSGTEYVTVKNGITYTRRLDYATVQAKFDQNAVSYGGNNYNYTYEDVINLHMAKNGNNAEYVFAQDYSGTDSSGRSETTMLGRTLTQGPKYKYQFNDNLSLMAPNTEYPNKRYSDSEIAAGITVNLSNPSITKSPSLTGTISLDKDLVGTEPGSTEDGHRGYHYYSYTLDHGTQVPIIRWTAWGNSIASHSEGNKAKEGYHTSKTGSDYAEAYYVDASENRKGQWAWYHGILYHGYLHSPTYTYIYPDGNPAHPVLDVDNITFPNCGDKVNYYKLIYDKDNERYLSVGEPISPCGLSNRYNGTYEPYWNNTAWKATCAICGETIGCNDNGNDFTLLWYGKKEQFDILTVLQMGREIVLSCGRCGGMENQAWYSHDCKAISPNRYSVKYDPNTTDMVYGGPARAVWLTNFETNYNGVELSADSPINKIKRINASGYIREGYVFKGWAYSATATIPDFYGNESLLLLQNEEHATPTLDQIRTGNYHFYENYHETVLYAVWEPEVNAFSVDVNTEKQIEGTGSWNTPNAAFNPVGTLNAVNAYTEKRTSNTIKESVNVTIDKNKVNYPAGTNVIFHSQEYGGGSTGKNLDGNTSNPSQVEKRGAVSANNVYAKTTIHGNISNVTQGSDGSITFTYKYGYGGYVDSPDVLYVSYEQGPVIMPPIDPPNNTISFIGWYDSAGNFLGMPGDSYPSPASGTMHIYPKFSAFKLDVEDLYYKSGTGQFGQVVLNGNGESENGDTNTSYNPALGVSAHHATGAVNLKISLIGSPVISDVFQLQYKKGASGTWTNIQEDGSQGSTASPVDSGAQKVNGSYTIPKTGFYKITGVGGDGIDYDASHVGGRGAKAYTTVFLKVGDVISWTLGTKGGGIASTSQNAAGNATLNGGQYTQVFVNGAEILVAGGGGGASSEANGGDASPRDGYVGSSNDFSGGGATVTPPVAHVHHNHELSGCTKDGSGKWTCDYPDQESCNYHEHTGDPSAGTGCYTGAATTQTCPGVGHQATGGGFYHGEGATTSSTSCRQCGETSRYGTATTGDGRPLFACWHPWGFNCPVCGRDTMGVPSTSGYSGGTVSGTTVGYHTVSGQHSVGDGCPLWDGANNRIYTDYVNETVNGHNIYWTCPKTSEPGSAVAGTGGDIRIDELSDHLQYTSSPKGHVAGDAASVNNGNGYVQVQSVQLGYLTASSGEYIILDFPVTDTTAPGPITLAYNKAVSGGTVTWKKPENPRGQEKNGSGVINSTSYYFKAIKGSITGSGTPGSTIETPEIRVDIVSAIAGYYYCYDNTKTTVIGESNAYKGANSYTWGDHFNNNGGNYGFVSGTSVPNVEAARGGRLYMHVAAVDVAGNVGPTSTIEFENETTTSDKWVVELIFDPNPMEYQLEPKTNIAYTTTTGLHNISTGNVVGSRIKGGYYLYANGQTTGNDGSYSTGFGTKTTGVRYGQAWPNMTNAKFDDITFSFQGWNTKPDGKGTWISQSGSGDGSGSSPANAKKFVPKDYVTEWESYKYDLGQIIAPKVRIYAIWREYASLFVQAAYQKATVNALTGAVSFEELLLGQPSQPGYPIRSLETPWSKLAVLRTAGNGYATGRDYYLLTQNGHDMRVYPTRIPGSTVSTAFTDHKITQLTNSTVEIFGSDNPNETVEYWDRPFDLGFKGQGTYNIRGQIYSKQARSTPNATGNEQGAYSIGDVTNSVIRIDMTPPTMINGTVKQKKLSDYTAAQVEAWGNGTLDLDLTTTFRISVRDRNLASYGELVSSAKDSSGIAGVFLRVKDMNGTTEIIYPMNNESITENTKDGTGIYQGIWTISTNLYADFPMADELDYEIFAVDRAGNVSDTIGNLSDQDKGTPVGYLINFSAKTIIKNDTNTDFNLGEGLTHFFVGDYGHVDIWTVGFVSDVEMEFGAVGVEAINEINNGVADMHNMGARAYDPNYVRKIGYANGYEVRPASITVFNRTTHTWRTLTPSDGADYNKALSGELVGETMPQPYARKYTATGSNPKWDDQGTSQRIGPNYPLSSTGYEIWNYAVFGYKRISKTKATSTYIICDPGQVDLHYRITHED